VALDTLHIVIYNGTTMSSERSLSVSAADRGDRGSVQALLPRSVVSRIESVRDDVRMFVAGLSGRTPPPFTKREPLARHLLATPAPAVRDLLATRTLRVMRVVRETPDAVSLYLQDPTGRRISFVPGQFFTLLVTLPSGEVVRRAYSIASLPDADGSVEQARITIKRIASGTVSNLLNDTATEGATFEVLGPSGNFTTTYASDKQRHLVLFAGGSGITPLLSIAMTTLSREPKSRVSLVYGNRSEKDIIYHDELGQLVAKYGDRFVVRHVLTNPGPGFSGRTGLLDRDNTTAAIQDLPSGDDYFICGPEPMMQAVRRAIEERGAPAASIHEERYSSPARRVRQDVPLLPQRILVRAGGQERNVLVKAGQTLLEAGLEGAIAMPFSCSMGGCGACRVKLVSGEVMSDEPNCLSADEQREGFVLACVTRPSSTCVVEVP
jgi:ring-1,2-phenylacetyl-CoA epoxidase subunit PaaE